jgi:hypothetical protein
MKTNYHLPLRHVEVNLIPMFLIKWDYYIVPSPSTALPARQILRQDASLLDSWEFEF